MSHLTKQHLETMIARAGRGIILGAVLFLFSFASSTEAMEPPVVSAVYPTEATLNSLGEVTIEIDASGSFDPDGGTIDQTVLFQLAPHDDDDTNGILFQDSTGALIFNAVLNDGPDVGDPPTIYSLSLFLVDSGGQNSSEQFEVTVHPHVPKAPEVNAGPDDVIHDTDRDGTETVQLNGSATDDETIASYLWQERHPSGAIDLGTTPTLNVPLGVGTHDILLSVTDNEGLVGTDSIQIVINDLPIANAGPDIDHVNENNAFTPITLDGSQSTDGGSIVDYKWEVAGPLILAQGANPTAETSLEAGSYVVTLTVTDNNGAAATDTFVINVTNEGTGPTPPGVDPIIDETPEESINYIHPGSSQNTAEIVYHMSGPGSARITIYDQRSNVVKEITSPFHNQANRYSVEWDCRNDAGESVVSGIYHVLLDLGGTLQRQTIVVVK